MSIPSPARWLSPSPRPCSSEDWLCQEVEERTGSDWLAAAADWLIAKPLVVLSIVVLALLARWLVNRLVDRVVSRASLPAPVLGRNGERTAAQEERARLVAERRRQRAETMASVLKSIASFVVVTVAVMMIAGELGYDIGPLVASAGLVGVALGFGAQSLVKDFLSGIFMFFEDQLGVGDEVVVGETRGVVEALTLRVTRVRAEDGTIWYLRNGEILKVGNISQGEEPPPRPAPPVGSASGSEEPGA